MSKAFIKAVDYYLPENVLTNEQIAERFPEWNAEKVANKVGIKERHLSGKDETAADLAYKAAEKLFAQYPEEREKVDFLLLCSQSVDYKLPSSSCILQNRLGLKTSCGAFDFNLGCSGYEYGLAVAKGLIVGGIATNVLVLTAETYTKYIHPEDKGNQTIFGDAGTATIVAREGFAEIGEFVLGTDGSGAEMLMLKTGGARLPKKAGCVTEDGNDTQKWDDNLYMDGGAIFNFTSDVVPVMVEQLLKKENLDQDGVDLWIFHQANKYMINYLRKLMCINKEKFYVFMEHVGNTVSNTIPIALYEAQKEGLLKGNVLLAGFGVGLSWGATMLHCK
ncbi:ketoacyl-ACP synthase III [Bacteroides sp. CG01]|uniref:3-oxoacyl-ACP synthase III family protein n=1 Tax=Bacteroides sp. CG01 TaxID=3096000 RepID=UPI002B26094D|nr:ketoacyl-ACP synthase III [Bacteroides sp. CG01]